VQLYFDCNATTPMDPSVLGVVRHFLEEEYGNAGSRTHQWGSRAKQAVAGARAHVASVVAAEPADVVFTSGATESNNIAILGLADTLRSHGRTHIVSTAIEHKAVLEPLERLSRQGFEIDYLSPGSDGRIDVAEVSRLVRDDTGLVSVMHVNNETGVIQPVEEIGQLLEGRPTLFHVDAAQGFGKVSGLDAAGIDLISISGHKVYAPMGVGALVARRRGMARPDITPLQVGGGQERGIRPGTLPVPLIAGLGEAARLALADRESRERRCVEIKAKLLKGIADLPHTVNGSAEDTIASTLNVAFHGVDAEAALVCLKDIVAISNGSACTSNSYTESHVLQAMGLPQDRIRQSLRWSWSHLTPDPPMSEVREALKPLLA